MEFREFTAGKDDDGRRLDRILRIFLKDKSLGEIYSLLRKGLIKVTQKKAKPDLHVKENDVILIADFHFREFSILFHMVHKACRCFCQCFPINCCRICFCFACAYFIIACFLCRICFGFYANILISCIFA